MNRKMCVVLLLAGLVAAASLGTNRGATSSDLDPGEVVTPLLFPAPRDTEIAYDDSTLLPVIIFDNTARYWAVLFDLFTFLPDTLCSLKAGLISMDTAGTAPTCSFFVWEDMGGAPQEPPVYATEVLNPGEFPIWDTVVTPDWVCSTGTFFLGYWISNVGPNPFEQDVPVADQAPPPGSGHSWYSEDRSIWRPFMLDFMGFGDLGIRAMVTLFERPPAPVRDVQPVLILEPPDTVICGDPYAVEARVQNNGDSVETFDVTFMIDTLGGSGVLHNETRSVNNLGIGATQDVNFWPPTFIPPYWDSTQYLLTVYTSLSVDDSTWNDTLIDTIFGYCIWNHDVKPDSLWGPGDTVWCGDTVDVAAYVSNDGDLEETFYFKILIDDSLGGNVYAESVSVTLASMSQTIRVFPQWPVPTTDSMNYTVRMVTLLPGDMNTSNDTLLDSVFGYCFYVRDVGPVSLIWPPDTVYCDSSGDVTARVTNLGTISEDFSVEAVIETSGEAIYTDTADVVGLAPAETTDVVFAQWVVPQWDMMTYDITIATLLGDDSDPGNDVLAAASYGLCAVHDGGVVSIDSPPDSVYVDSTYTPAATVENFGNRTETFDVVCTIDGYADTASVVDLGPGLTDQVSFADWMVAGSGPFTICVKALVGDDGEPSNDSLCQTIETYVGVEELRRVSWTPDETRVLQNVPNPFTGSTVVHYTVAEPGRVSLYVYDASGRTVKVLVDEHLAAGAYTVDWDGKDEIGNPMSSGIYFHKLVSGKTVESRKMVLVR